MVPENGLPAGPECRPPTVEDLVLICRHLNQLGARYVVVGGFAIIQHGLARATQDIDILIESSLENQARVKQALECLPDKAVRELREDDLRDWVVVRIGDEVVVDLMTSACGVDFATASSGIELVTVQGEPIPFASAELLLRMKQTAREKDHEDRLFLEAKLRSRRVTPAE